MPENPLRRSPGPDAEVITHLPALAYLPVLAEEGTWAEVVYDGRRGWIDAAWKPTHNRRKARRGLLRHRQEPVRASSFLKLDELRKIFGVRKPNRSLGPYQLFTDVEDEALLAFLHQVASVAEDAYFARFGRLPSGDPLRTAVLFAREGDYREYSKSVNLPSNTHAGHAGSGVLIFYAEGRSWASLAGTLVHEIGHLLNDRSLAKILPPWLEEGIAEELSSIWLEMEETTDTGGYRIAKLTERDAQIVHLHGLLEKGRLPTLGTLLGRDRDTFYTGGSDGASYSMSGTFIRFLMEGDDRRHAPGFRNFLGRIAGGMQANLIKELEADPAAIEESFRAFVKEEYQAVEGRFPDFTLP